MSLPFTSVKFDPSKVEECINDLALLTLTNAPDWNHRFSSEGDLGNPTGKDVIIFSHPSGLRFHCLIADLEADSEEPKPDVEIRFEGSLALFEPLTTRASAWIKKHIESPIYFGCALVVEHRYAKQVAKGMKADGLLLA
jgi:hypothetical protein